ncbi:MAG TPA: hypothetical protein VEX60_15550 [Pyrinomonadaceae bacterium]|nr:hypothetical protein [Pyrinomonadaceae bacterium]
MREELETVYERLHAWCRARGYAGHDPFDALNSRLFQATPLRRSRLARLVWTQAFKRSPVNLRSLARVPAERNSKGTALFALAALSRLRATRDAREEREARALLDDLLEAKIETAHGAAWGYNFDWQGRAFYAPRGTPTVVPTAFAVRALVEATNALNTAQEEDALSEDVRKYLTAAERACLFIAGDLNRGDESKEEVCFSYTPLDRTRVFNASLLAGEALASVGALAGRAKWVAEAQRAARYVVRRQREDGSWAYGADSYQSWADNFHTAFVLTSLARILKACGRKELESVAVKNDSDEQMELESVAVRNDSDAHEEIRESIRRGYAFWRASFFLADGWPKYYHHSAHPADAHSAGAAVVACVELSDLEPDALELATRVARWAVRELYDSRGFFYYQKRRLHTVRTPYMRWSQAWMMYALALLLESRAGEWGRLLGGENG